ncbi:hypothetical protein D3C72_675090 [compost metagenome]
MGSRRKRPLPHQDDRRLGAFQQFHSTRRLDVAGALAHETIAIRGRGGREGQFGLHDAERHLDIGRPRHPAHGATEGFVQDLVGLLGILDDADVFHTAFEQARLTQILHLSATHTLFIEALALSHDEDGGNILLGQIDGASRDIGHPRSLVDAQDARLAGQPVEAISHQGAALLMTRRNHAHAALFSRQEEVEEAGIGNAEDRIHALGLDEFCNPFGHLAGRHGTVSREEL